MSDRNTVHLLFGHTMVLVSVGSIVTIEKPMDITILMLAIIVLLAGVSTIIGSLTETPTAN